MKMRYSPSAAGFFPDNIDYGDDLPNDLVDITEELYTGLLAGQSAGKIIITGNKGLPELAERPAPTKRELISAAENKKSVMLQDINEKTQIWQTQLALKIITDADKATLTAWMRYAQAVQAVDASVAPDISWPAKPQ